MVFFFRISKAHYVVPLQNRSKDPYGDPFVNRSVDQNGVLLQNVQKTLMAFLLRMFKRP